MNRNNEVTLVAADAFVMYYDTVLTKWMASGASKSVTIAKVQLLQNLASNQFRIFAWNPINKEVLVNSMLYHNLRYQKAHSTFHEWRDADTQMVYGLHFADSKDASMFGEIISKVFKSLELIYQQCRELQAQIRATSASDKYNQSFINPEKMKLISCNTLNPEHSTDSRNFEFSPISSPQTNEQAFHYSQASRSDSISIAKPTNVVDKHCAFFTEVNNSETEGQSPHNYENIDSLFLKHPQMKSISGQENIELSNKCQSSSDDSVRGLKRQPSSTSSGYATVASMTEQYSPTPGLTSSFSMVAETLNKCILDSKTKNQNSSDYSTGLIQQSEAVVTESTPSSFATQLQSMIQLRKVNPSSARAETSASVNFHPNNLKGDTGKGATESICDVKTTPKESQSFVDPRSSCNSKIVPVDDIMSEMKMKLQRRKQLIDGHTDPNYSSSTDKSDVSCSSTSDNGSFVDQFTEKRFSPKKVIPISEGSNCRSRLSELSTDNKTLLEDEERSSPFSENFRSISQKKMSTGDIIQYSTSSTVLASKQDLDRIKREITDDLRRDFTEAKKEVLDAIRLLKNVS